jgi:squalene-hopene/tetraprenyl-beta-curcumene cyclase
MKAFAFALSIGVAAATVPVAAWAVQESSSNRPGAATQETSRDAKILEIRSKAIAYLKASQADNGSFSEQLGPGVTALVTYALLRSDVPTNDPSVAKALEFMKQQVQPDGGVYRNEHLQNYETSLALMCFHEANRDGQFDSLIAQATQFVKKIQWDEDEGIDPSDARYGGQGYGSHKRPDLSNTGMFIDALESLGTDDNDPAIQEAIKFISNTQNLDAPFNTTKFRSLVNDGGFYYTPAGEGESKAGNTANGGLRSYGSMTYVGFKSLLYAGVDRDDPRVRAALQWIADHYTLEENPGVEQQGLYYYYHVFAKSLAAYGEPTLTDSAGKSHDWKTDMVDALAKRQRDDGSWINETDRWYEGDGGLVTGYCLLALSYCGDE